METCRIIKLKGASNNPALPIFETMQQFTLNAITASGNTEMTDAQKWALNHFFYQIGAISNSGIYPKLEALVLSFIGGTKAGALTDFAKNNQPSSVNQAVSFSGGGFTGSANNQYICNYEGLTEIDENYFFALVAGTSEVNQNISFIGERDDDAAQYGFAFNRSLSHVMLSSSPYVQYSTFVEADYSGLQNVIGSTIRIKNDGAKCLIFNAASIADAPIIKANLTETGVAVDKVTPKANIENTAPYAFCLGSGLTDAEQTKFTDELRILVAAFLS